MMEKEVTCKWLTDGKLAVIYQVGNLLLFYTTENDPKFKQGEMLSMERADESKPYKATRFSWNNVPNDAYMAFVW